MYHTLLIAHIVDMQAFRLVSAVVHDEPVGSLASSVSCSNVSVLVFLLSLNGHTSQSGDEELRHDQVETLLAFNIGPRIFFIC